ncbi:MAG TPA: pyridoxal phosphate-dependent aminotransferase [Vicinamibacterales bacterium]|nr:pyridoxal phosphate-dependent aminotransferase [Vicinamibacterales bacterium]
MFSSRLPATLAPNAISRALAQLRADGVSILDLTETNPTNVDLPYGSEIAEAFSRVDSRRYAPDPAGLLSAREAVAREYAGDGVTVDPAHVLLTASTSEAYALLFKLLCNPGDHVLVPQPSYPLFDSLTQLEGVVAQPYRLRYDGYWTIDRASVEDAISNRTRAILVVNPNNPTGSLLRADDREWLVARASAARIAVIADEVFAGYPLRPGADAVSCLGESRVLTFVLGGLSKAAGLPQMKLAWILTSGPGNDVSQAVSRLEIIADTYLSVSTPVQLAAPALLMAGRTIRAHIQERVRTNLEAVERLAGSTSPMTVLPVEGGWSAVIRVPATEAEEALVLRLLHDHGVLIHPGFFFDFPDEAYLVASLLPEPAVFSEAMSRVPGALGGDRTR